MQTMDETQKYNVSYCTDPLFKLNVLKKTTGQKCDVCLLSGTNPVHYGEFVEKTYKKRNGLEQKLAVHYFCLLSGTNIPQNGSNQATGVAGFQIRDVLNSCAEFRQKKCFYCGRSSAAIECAQNGCGRRFHYICGYNNSCLTQFFGSFLSYCDQHLPEEVRVPINTKDRVCDICFELLPQVTDTHFNPLSIVRPHCNSECPPGLLHRECVQRHAYSAGYNFRCPLCWEKKFHQHALACGIFVPQRESSWERVPGAFKDLHKRKCTAANCALKNRGKSTTMLVGCKVCGGQLQHMSCAGVPEAKDYLCSGCKDESFALLV